MIGELGLYCFVVLVTSGVYLVLLRPQRPPGRLRRQLRAAAGREVTEAYRSALELSLTCGPAW